MKNVEAVDMFRWIVMAGMEDMIYRAIDYGVSEREVSDELALALKRAVVRHKMDLEKSDAGH